MSDTNNANINILHITAVGGLATMINDHLDALTEETVEKTRAKLDAMKEISNWQAIALQSLRRIYE